MSQISVPRGTQDVLPDDWRLRQHIADIARARFEAAGFGRISTPTFEHTELYHRGVGETTDIVGKETYTFTDRGDRSLTLRPEGTAGVARAFINHGMHREPLPVKLWYSASMFRYEKPQAGRLREHEQLGCEALGSEHPGVDAEVIAVQAAIYRDLELPDLVLHLNSVGSGEARAAYREALVGYLTPLADQLDDDSRERLTLNPLRILDTKHPRTRELLDGAPLLPDFLTEDDRTHFAGICAMLEAAGVTYVVDPLLVRGLDYYTRTVWEFTSSALGAQSTVGAGGRYDGLVEQLGGPATPGVGFGTGIERIVLCLEAMGRRERRPAPVLLVGVDPEASSALFAAAFGAVQELRNRGHLVDLDVLGRSENALRKTADRNRVPLWLRVTDEGASLNDRATRERTELPADLSQSVDRITEALTSAK